MSTKIYKTLGKLFTEGKQKQARIAADKEKTKVGASSSNQPRDPRYSPSMSSLRTSKGDIKRRKEALTPGSRETLRDRKYYKGRPSRKQESTYRNLAYLFLGETRSRTSRIKTTARKATAEHQKRKEKGKSVGAEGAGRRAGKEIATAKARRGSAKDISQWSEKNPGSTPTRKKERKAATASAVTALEREAAHKERVGSDLIKHGKRYAHNQKVVNKLRK
jgi:hypothetical protein